jgi:hypothetical protein
MKNIFKAILALGISLGSFSCTSYLDMTPTDSVSDKLIWETTENAEYHVNYIYSYVYDVLMNQCVAGQTEALTEQFHTISAKMYEKAQQAQAAQQGAGMGQNPNMGNMDQQPGAGQQNASNDNVVDADFEVVDDEN